MMNAKPTRYAVLRDLRQWHGVSLSGLTPAEDGVLSLSALPAPLDGNPIAIPGPFDSEPSGISLGPCNDVVVSDTAKNQVIWRDGVCHERSLQLASGRGTAPGQFSTPTAVLILKDSLYVADTGNARIQVFRAPTLELRAIWNSFFRQPTGIAIDSQDRIYVLDRGLKKILRLNASGVQDQLYNPPVTDPAFLTIDGEDRLYVSDATLNQVLRFDENQTASGPVPLAAASMRPRALAAHGDRIYIADADGGYIWALDATSNAYLGTVPGYRGPVSAMTIAPDGSLWIKPQLDAGFYKLDADQVFVGHGSITTNVPIDAGMATNWARVHAAADSPAGTSAEMRLITAVDPTPKPTESDWAAAVSLPLNTLVPPLAPHSAKAGSKRFLWIRVLLSSDLPSASPQLRQIEAETTSPSYLDYLPAVYRRADASTGFLERWLKFMQGEIDDWEWMLDSMPRQFDPLMAPENRLAWLAKWLAFPLPNRASEEALRNVFARIPDLYTRRGTPCGLRDMTELYTGVSPALFEAFHGRRIWQLGETSALGVETVLPAALPDGMIVPGWTVANPDLMGLRGDYYDGTNFQTLRATRTDPDLDFASVQAPDPLGRANAISVRWTGQVQPPETDVYTFSIDTTEGVRLWIDGRLLIDSWESPGTQNSGRFTMAQGIWYPITLEYFSVNGGDLHLSWSSPHQPIEIIPHQRLYAVRDEYAVLPAASKPSPVLVGQTVVGECGPLAGDDYGSPLFSETAHLFTVVVPAARVRGSADREALRAAIEREKPAHTDYHLCLVEPRMRVGFQARIGIDSIVAGPAPPLSLQGTTLGLDSFLGDDDTGGSLGRVGSHGHIGFDTVVG
jgi:phage tail-like protein